MDKSFLKFAVILLIIPIIISCATTQKALEQAEALRLQRQEFTKKCTKGWSELALNNFDLATKTFEEIIEIDTSFASAYRGLAVALYCSGKEFEAANALAECVRHGLSDPLSAVALSTMWDHLPFDMKIAKKLVLDLTKNLDNREIPISLRREYAYFVFDFHRYRAGNVEAAKQTLNSMKIMDDWSIIGPFENVSNSGFGVEYIPYPSESVLKAKDAIRGKNNWELKWFAPPLKSYTPIVPLSDYLSGIQYSSIYAFSKFQVDEDGKYAIIFSKAGTLEVWLDGNLILNDGEYTSGKDVHWLYHELTKGSHSILVKVGNREDLSGFGVSIIAEYNEPIPSDLFNGLFPISQFDPLINAVADSVEKNPKDIESLTWMALLLGKKGWWNQSHILADRYGSLFPDESLLLDWIRGLIFAGEGREYKQRAILTKIAETRQDFAPARRYVIDDFLSQDRISKAQEYISELNKQYPEWYYGLEGDMIVHFIRNESKDAFEVFNKLKKLYPNCPEYFEVALRYGVDLSIEQIDDYVLRLERNGLYVLSRMIGYHRAFARSDEPQAKRFLQDFLQQFPINEQLWLEYIQLLLDIGAESYDDIRKKNSAALDTFPMSYGLLNTEKTQANAYYKSADAFLQEYRSEMSPSYAAELKSKIEKQKNQFENALSDLINYYPYNLELRDEKRILNDEMPFARLADRSDSQDLINEYYSNDLHHDEADAVVVYDGRQEVYFGKGAASRFVHLIVQTLSPKGVEDHRFFAIDSHPVFDTISLSEAYIIKQDGSLIYADYSGWKIGFPGLAPGDCIVVRYRLDRYTPGDLNDEFWTSVFLQSTYPIFRKEYILIYPEEKSITAEYKNISQEEINSVHDTYSAGYKRFSFEITDIPAVSMYVNSPHWKDLIPWIDISTVSEWSEIVDWYKDLYRGQCFRTYAIESKVKELCDGLEHRDDRIKAIYNFVSNSIEYEDLSFQYSAFVPETAEAVMLDGYGDCKDQSVLLIAMLEIAGIESYIALNTPDYSGKNPYLPSSRFSHTVVIVPDESGEIVLDPTSQYLTFPELPPSLIGTYILPIIPGETLRIIKGNSNVGTSTILTEISGQTGSTTVTGSIIPFGPEAGYYRSLFRISSEFEKRARLSGLLSGWMPGFKLDAYSVTNEKNVREVPIIDFKGEISIPFAMKSGELLCIDIPWAIGTGELIDLYSGIETKTSDLETNGLFLSTPRCHTIIFDIPAKYKIMSIPESAEYKFETAYAKFSYEEKREKLICRFEIFVPKLTVNVDKLNELKSFLGNVIEKERHIVLLKVN